MILGQFSYQPLLEVGKTYHRAITGPDGMTYKVGIKVIRKATMEEWIDWILSPECNNTDKAKVERDIAVVRTLENARYFEIEMD